MVVVASIRTKQNSRLIVSMTICLRSSDASLQALSVKGCVADIEMQKKKNLANLGREYETLQRCELGEILSAELT